jgi:hypothetical protein
MGGEMVGIAEPSARGMRTLRPGRFRSRASWRGTIRECRGALLAVAPKSSGAGSPPREKRGRLSRNSGIQNLVSGRTSAVRSRRENLGFSPCTSTSRKRGIRAASVRAPVTTEDLSVSPRTFGAAKRPLRRGQRLNSGTSAMAQKGPAPKNWPNTCRPRTDPPEAALRTRVRLRTQQAGISLPPTRAQPYGIAHSVARWQVSGAARQGLYDAGAADGHAILGQSAQEVEEDVVEHRFREGAAVGQPEGGREFL